jgi:PAS domain S-box-containing protein
MTGADQSDGQESSTARPFELDLSQDVCDRATRLAKSLFGAVDAQIALVKDGRAWRSRDANSAQPLGLGPQIVLDTRKPLWVEDGLKDLRFSALETVIGPPYVRFFAGAPICLADGETAGVIAVMGLTPRAHDSSLENRLTDLAAFVADQWERAQATKARERGRQERDALAATFAGVVKAMPVSLVITDRQYRVLGCSPRWASESGLAQDEAIGRSVAELRPAEFKRWIEPFERVMTGETIQADRVRYEGPDGASRWINVEMAPWLTADGEIGGGIVASHDVSSMVEALETAERSEQRLTLAMEMADIHVWEMDYVRRELTKVGCEDTFFTEPKTYDDLVRDIYGTIDPRDRPAVEAAWQRHVEDGAPYRPEYRVIRADDREVWTSGAAKLITDRNGRPKRLIGAMQNITERKVAEEALLQAKEEAEHASLAKSSFLAAMSHEIRTPLNGVLGMAQAMAADPLPAPQRQRLDVIRQSGETLLTILNDILDLSKIEAGKLVLEETDFDLGDLAGGVHAAFAPIATRKNLEFELAVEPAAHGVYRGDCTRVRQILYNLVSNALKFTETGAVRIGIRRATSGFELAVSDTGIGIPADRLPQLFQKFEQADASTTRRYGGTGLGLAICRELADGLGGTIRVESVEGHGATFIAFLPMQRVGDAKDKARGSKAAPVEKDEVRRIRVLAAEDNTVNQLVLKTLLNQAGIDPFIVSDGSEAVTAWTEREWDVILMDVQMPVLDGPSATRAIRELEIKRGRARTPIIALTANAMAHQVAEYTQAGMDGFVAKPVRIESLFEAIEKAISPGDDAGSEGALTRTGAA